MSVRFSFSNITAKTIVVTIVWMSVDIDRRAAFEFFSFAAFKSYYVFI
eukprot:SAG31_NODE_2970_length_4839_cov_2.684810_4_plen_48_part_00